jgi:hypothetical protein
MMTRQDTEQKTLEEEWILFRDLECPISEALRILPWEDGVKEGVEKLGFKNWTVVGLNREGWRKLLKEAEAHSGL